MTSAVNITGNVTDADVKRLQLECDGIGMSVALEKQSRQVDSSVITLTAQLVATIAGLLGVYVQVLRMFSPELTYERLIERIEQVMAERNVNEIEVLDVAGFRPKAARGLDDPCVVTLRDVKTSAVYKVFYSSHKNVFAVEIQKVG
jgi:hypothetical protein